MTRAYATQAQSFYLFSCNVCSKYNQVLPDVATTQQFDKGSSLGAVFAPDGSKITESVSDDFDGVTIAELDMDAIISQKNLVDVVGHYSRPDLLSLTHNNPNDQHVIKK